MQSLLSLCMIVKNEEKVLERCLKSVQGLVDEIIVIDTGSTDSTKDIAKQFQAKVYDFIWTNSFADARNESIKYASGRWILFLDADEYVQPDHHADFRRMLESLNRDHPTAIILPIINFNGTSLQLITGSVQSKTTRVFNNNQGFYFENPIHEQLLSTKGELEFLQDSFQIYHTGYIDETKIEKNKSQRNLELHNQLKMQVGLNTYYNFTLGNEYSNLPDYEKALYYYKKADKKSSEDKLWYSLLLDRLVVTNYQLKRYHDALKYCEKGLARYPQAVDYYYLKAAILYEIGLYEEALTLAEQTLSIAESKKARSEQYWITSTDYGSTFVYVLLSNVYAHYFNLEKQVLYLSKALNEKPSNPQYLVLLLQQFKGRESKENILSFFQRHYPPVQIHDMLLVYSSAVRVGYAPLAETYYEAVRLTGFGFSRSDQLQHQLLLHQAQSVAELIVSYPYKEISNHEEWMTLLMAAFISRDFTSLSRICETSDQTLLSAVDELIHFLENRTNLIQTKSPWIAQLLSKLMVYEYFEEYDQLIQVCTDPYYLNHMGNEFAEAGQIELALQYYQRLESNGTLEAKGYYYLGRLFVLQEDAESQQEGLQALDKAIQLDPNFLPAYIFYCRHETNPNKKHRMKHLLISHFAHLSEIREIKNI